MWLQSCVVSFPVFSSRHLPFPCLVWSHAMSPVCLLALPTSTTWFWLLELCWYDTSNLSYNYCWCFPGNLYLQPPSWISRYRLKSGKVDSCSVSFADLQNVILDFGILHLADSRAVLSVFQFFQPPSWISRCHLKSPYVPCMSIDFVDLKNMGAAFEILLIGHF